MVASSGTLIVKRSDGSDWFEEELDAGDIPITTTGSNFQTAGLAGDTIQDFASSVADNFPSGVGVLDNNSYIQWRNALDTLDINIIKLDSSDNVIINSTSGTVFDIDGATKWQISSAGYFLGNQTANLICTNTENASDTQAIGICGGGPQVGWVHNGRGGFLELYGNEHASRAGDVKLSTGVEGDLIFDKVGSGEVKFQNNGGDLWTIPTSESIFYYDGSYARIQPSPSSGTNKFLSLAGGDTGAWGSGARILLVGNTHALTGRLRFEAGNVSGGDIYFNTKAIDRWRIDYANGDLIPDSTGTIGTTSSHVSALYVNDIEALDGAGTTGQTLTKTASGTEWVTPLEGGEEFLFFSVQTIDNTATTVGSIIIPEEETIPFIAIVAGRGPSNKNYWSTIQGGVRRNTAGDATLVGTPLIAEDAEGTPGYSSTVTTNGSALRVTVSGASAETVDWETKILYVSDAAGSTIVNGNDFQTFDVQTTDATETTLYSVTLADDTIYKFTVDVIGRLDSTIDNSVWGTLEFGARRNDGSDAVLIGTRLKTSDSEGSHGYDFDVAVSGTDVQVSVTGSGSETVNWSAGVKYLARS